MKDARIERIPQEGNGKENSFPGIYEEASHITRGVLRAIQEVAGTTYCKGVQIAELTKWAKANGYWFVLANDLNVFSCIHTGNITYFYMQKTMKIRSRTPDIPRKSEVTLPIFQENPK